MKALFLAALLVVAGATSALAGPTGSQYSPPCWSGGAPCTGTNAPTFPPYVPGSLLTQPVPNNGTYYGTAFGQVPPVNGSVLAGRNNAWVGVPLAELPWSTTLTSGTCSQALVLDSGGTLVLGACGGGSGTVTSVGLSAPSWLTVAGSPITTSGTFAITGTSESANLFLASPNGSAGAVTPRAIVNADLPASGVSAGSYTSTNITVNSQGIVTAASNGSGGGAVSSVSNSDGTLTISPTTGAVIASLAPLPNTDLFVGNGSGIATAVALSGDCTLANTGAITCLDTGGTPFGVFATSTAASNLTGNLNVGQFNGGTGATSSTFWRGDLTWAAIPTGCPTGQTTWDGTTNLTVSATTGVVYTIGSTPVAAARTLTLPVAASFGIGCTLQIIDGAKIFNLTNVVTPTRQGGDTIDGATTGTPFGPSTPIVQTAEFTAVATSLWNTLKAPSIGSFTPVSHQFLTGVSTTGFSAAAIGLTDLPSLSANTILGALTATTPSGLTVPSCSTASNALTWTSGTGFGCNTISGSGTVNSGTSGQVAWYASTGTAVSGNTDVLISSNNLIDNQNAASAPAFLASNSGIQVVGVDSAGAAYITDSFAAAGTTTYRRAAGTGASRTAVTGNSTIGVIGGSAYNGTAYASSLNSNIGFQTLTTQTTGNSDGRITFSTTPTSATSNSFRGSFEGDGTLYVGASTSVTANNTGAGTVNTDTGYFVGGAALNFSNLAGAATFVQLPAVTGPMIVGRVTNTSGALSAAYTPTNGTDSEVVLAHGSFTAGDGVKANDTTGTLVDSGTAAGLTHFDIGYIAGVNLTTNPTEVSIALPVGMTITSMVGHVGAAVGGTATIDIYEAPSGTACASGTKLTNTTNFNANGTANTDQTLAGTTSTITANDRLCLVAAGAGWSSSVGSGGVTIWAHP